MSACRLQCGNETLEIFARHLGAFDLGQRFQIHSTLKAKVGIHIRLGRTSTQAQRIRFDPIEQSRGQRWWWLDRSSLQVFCEHRRSRPHVRPDVIQRSRSRRLVGQMVVEDNSRTMPCGKGVIPRTGLGVDQRDHFG